MSVMFQVHLHTNEDIIKPKIALLFWTSFALCAVVFQNCDAANIPTNARVSHCIELPQRHKMKALHIMFLF